jgi:hypothetical protein
MAMINRRDVALGGLLTIGWLAAPCGCAAHAASAAPQTFGCTLTDDQADAVFAANNSSTFGPGESPTLVSSGDRDLDYALAQTLSRLTDTWNVLPGFAWFDDSAAPNAFATQRRLLSRDDGSVLFGRKMLERCLKVREHPDVAVSAVCAHEFGHIAQYKFGLTKQLSAGQTSVKRVELHADFLAGYFAGVRKLEKPDFPAAVYATTQYGFGDAHLDSIRHHGLPEERAAAIVKGFEVAFRDRGSPKEALAIGLRYVQSV